VDGPSGSAFHEDHLADGDLALLRRLAGEVASAFCSRLLVADFARGEDGRWWFIEAGPGSCAGTAHEAVFKAVAARLPGEEAGLVGDASGGLFCS
jgi:hypothetical protein